MATLDMNFIILEKLPSIGAFLVATGGAMFVTDLFWHEDQDRVSTTNVFIY